MTRTGHIVMTTVGGETVRAFVPPPLPPIPRIEMGGLLRRLTVAERALGRLDGITVLLPRQELFLDRVAEIANQAFDAAGRIVDLFRRDREMISSASDRAGSALRVHDLLQQNPYAISASLVAKTGLTTPTVNAALADLERLGIVEEVTGRKRQRVFAYRGYLEILNEGTDPIVTS